MNLSHLGKPEFDYDQSRAEEGGINAGSIFSASSDLYEQRLNTLADIEVVIEQFVSSTSRSSAKKEEGL